MNISSKFCSLGIAGLLLSFNSFTNAQILTSEDSLNAGLVSSDRSTYISGYGEAKYQNDLTNKTASINLTRAVLFIGHRFNNNISFFSELELEDAKIAGGETGGEISFEQLFLKFNINHGAYLCAGLFTPRIGIINENHLPTTYYGNDRPMVERLVIPATWRELGVSLYGNIQKAQGLNYSIALVNGLNSSAFENGTGIRDGRFEGREATASNLALTGSLLYYFKDFRFQVSGYYGGSAGMSKAEADTLQLNAGAFGTPVALGETNIQYEKNGLEAKALFTIVNIADAYEINRAYDNNTPETMIGGYFEVGYNILKAFNKSTLKQLTCFIRYEDLNLNSKVPDNGIEIDLNKQSYLTTGISYLPIRGVIIKADYQVKKSGDSGEKESNSYFNIGLGYCF